ncbi:MAG: ATP-binding cassette domain-containing protein [Treponema sp.]|nr:ATP-binding cassette domain-containing protein [Treponema sp.]
MKAGIFLWATTLGEKGGLSLNEVNIGLEAGERLGLLRPSGCGKNTLAKILDGFLRPISGRAYFEDKLLPEQRPSPIQLIYQHPENAINPRWKMGRTLCILLNIRVLVS